MTSPKTPPQSRLPREEAIRIGKEIYKDTILPQIERDHHGEYVAIDVDTQKWAVATTTRAAVESLREQCPDAVNILCERVGYRALRSYGGSSLAGMSLLDKHDLAIRVQDGGRVLIQAITD